MKSTIPLSTFLLKYISVICTIKQILQYIKKQINASIQDICNLRLFYIPALFESTT